METKPAQNPIEPLFYDLLNKYEKLRIEHLRATMDEDSADDFILTDVMLEIDGYMTAFQHALAKEA